MTRVTRILFLTFFAIIIRPHPHTRILPLPIGRALPLPPGGWTLARPLAAFRTPHGKTWERALVGLLVGLLGLLSWQGVLLAWSPPDLPPMLLGAATRPSLALWSATSPVLTHRGHSPPALVAGLVSPPRDREALAAEDLDDEDSPSSLAVLTVGALLLPPTPTDMGTPGVKPPFFWPSHYLTRPQLLTRLSPLS